MDLETLKIIDLEHESYVVRTTCPVNWRRAENILVGPPGFGPGTSAL